jgi:tRNA-dihydrouridine synthase
LGSGDLFSAQDCIDMIQQTGVDGVTVARGAIGNPWIFHQARELAAGRPLPPPPTLHEQRDVIREHYRLAGELYGEQRGAAMMRKFGAKYAALHPEYERVRSAYTAVRSREDWENLFSQWYGDDAPGEYPRCELHAHQGEKCEKRNPKQIQISN